MALASKEQTFSATHKRMRYDVDAAATSSVEIAFHASKDRISARFDKKVEAVLTSIVRPVQAKAILRENTDNAIHRNVFGVPTILVDDELFWGVDSLPFIGT
jgi:2-hydroxychromene-2-carboxylate isomerase